MRGRRRGRWCASRCRRDAWPRSLTTAPFSQCGGTPVRPSGQVHERRDAGPALLVGGPARSHPHLLAQAATIRAPAVHMSGARSCSSAASN